MKTLVDLRYAARSLLKTPRPALAALACIAIGIGATVAVVTLINAVLIRQAPFPEADRLIRVWTARSEEDPRDDLSYPDFRDIREQVQSFEVVESVARTRLAVTLPEGTERMRGEAISPGYFELIGVRAALGRLFTPDEYAREGERVMVISDQYWKNNFGGTSDVLGRTATARTVYGAPDEPSLTYTIIGVLPPGFVGTIEEDVSDFWIPIEHYTPAAHLEDRNAAYLWVIARLKPGISLEAAGNEIATIGRQLADAYPDRPDDYRMWLERFGENWRGEIRMGLSLLLVASFLLLVIACTNVANLLLARLAEREHELGVRMTLGAGRMRILRQLLTESLLLATLGGIAGVVLAYWGIKAFVAFVNFDIPSYVEIGLDWRLVVLTLLVVGLTGIAFGVLPAWFGAQVSPNTQLRETARGAVGSRKRAFFGRSLVVAEIALTFMLLIAAALMMRSYENLTSVDLGYRTDQLLRMGITLNRAEFPSPAEWRRFAREAQAALDNYPGVRRASVVSGLLPPWPDRRAEIDLTFEGLEGEFLRRVGMHPVDPAYLEAMDIQLLHGRNFTESDDENGAPVLLITRGLARRMAGGEEADALHGQIRLVIDPRTERLSNPFEVVGVVEDIVWTGPRGAPPYEYDVFLPAPQGPSFVLSVAIYAEVKPESLITPLRQELGKLAPTSPVHWISTMKDELGNQYADSRFYTFLLSNYSISAVILAIIGIYGVLSNSVVRRFSELGMRMALGAARRDILRLVLRQGLVTVAVGIVIGIVLAVASLRVISSLLYGVSAGDPATFIAVAVGLILLAFVACYFPARRATKVDPAEALRQE